MTTNTAIDAFFSAMNEQDADAAAVLVAPEVEIVLGSHRMTGEAAIRELALQEDPQLTFENVPVTFEAQGDTRVAVVARRTSRWRENGELASEEEMHVLFDLDDDGRFTRIELS